MEPMPSLLWEPGTQNSPPRWLESILSRTNGASGVFFLDLKDGQEQQVGDGGRCEQS